MNRLPSSQAWISNLGKEDSRGRQPVCEVFKNDSQVDSPLAFFLPARYEANYRYPLVVWLHQDGASERQLSQVMPHISLQNYVGVGVRGTRACDAAGHQYDWQQTANGIASAEQIVMEAVEQASLQYSIHPERVFIAGYQAGGTMAQRIALSRPSEFAGVVSLGGEFPVGCRPLANIKQLRDLKLWMAFATESPDFSADAMSEGLRLLNAAKMQVEISQFASDDEMMVPVLRSMDQWLMSQVTGQAQPRCVPDWDTVPVEFSAN